MGCGVPGTNHLKVHGKPLCGDSYGYQWDDEPFKRYVKEGVACIACIRTLERNALARALGRLQEPPEGANIKTTLTTTERGDLIAVTLTDEDHRIESVVWENDLGYIQPPPEKSEFSFVSMSANGRVTKRKRKD